MARKDFGTLVASGLVRQPNATITEKEDGQLEGAVSFVVDNSNEGLVPDMGDAHPNDSRLELFTRSKTFNAAGKIEVSCSYIGLASDPTPPIAYYAGGSGQQPIETHVRFKELAGDVTEVDSTKSNFVTPVMKQLYEVDADTDNPKKLYSKIGTDAEIDAFFAASTGLTKRNGIGENGEEVSRVAAGVGYGLNGAKFDTDTGKFIEFSDPNNIKCGMSMFIHAGDQIQVSYWTKTVPKMTRKNKVFKKFPHPSIVVDKEVVSWMCTDVVIRQTGSIYNVNEMFLGSSKSEGFDLDWYQEAGSKIKRRDDALTL